VENGSQHFFPRLFAFQLSCENSRRIAEKKDLLIFQSFFPSSARVPPIVNETSRVCTQVVFPGASGKKTSELTPFQSWKTVMTFFSHYAPHEWEKSHEQEAKMAGIKNPRASQKKPTSHYNNEMNFSFFSSRPLMRLMAGWPVDSAGIMTCHKINIHFTAPTA
jgi:hypothetical protein